MLDFMFNKKCFTLVHIVSSGNFFLLFLNYNYNQEKQKRSLYD